MVRYDRVILLTVHSQCHKSAQDQGYDGLHLTMVAGVSNAMFLTIELPFTRVLSSTGVSLSGEYLFETWPGWWWTTGFTLGLWLLFLTVTQPVWGPGCSGSVRGRLMELATLGCYAPTKGTWLAIGWFSTVQSRASNSDNLTSKTTKRLHLLHVPLSLKKVEE